jgi:hypothetical protein
LSFDQLKKKAGPAPAAAPAKAAASPRNVPEKTTNPAPKTSLQDVKKFVQSDKKPEMPKTVGAKKPLERKEKTPQAPQPALDKQLRRTKDVEED